MEDIPMEVVQQIENFLDIVNRTDQKIQENKELTIKHIDIIIEALKNEDIRHAINLLTAWRDKLQEIWQQPQQPNLTERS